MDIKLTDTELTLLSMYALPHVHIKRDPRKNWGAAFAQLKFYGLVREGVGRALVPKDNQKVATTGNEGIEEFVSMIHSRSEPTPGWVVTQRGIDVMLSFVSEENRPKARAVMEAFVADKDPNVC